MNNMHTSEIIEPVSVDSVIFGFDEDTLKVLLIKRIADEYLGKWSLPGGYIRYNEDIDKAAERILAERTGVKVFMEQLGAFGKVNRFPERRIITIAYYALVKPDNYKLFQETDASDIQWIDVYKLPQLLFDHSEIIEATLKHLRRKVRIEPIGFNLLPTEFPLSALQKLYESVLNTTFDKPNFRRKILKSKLLIALDKKQAGVAHRSARLFMFDKKRYDEMVEKGYSFEL